MCEGLSASQAQSDSIFPFEIENSKSVANAWKNPGTAHGSLGRGGCATAQVGSSLIVPVYLAQECTRTATPQSLLLQHCPGPGEIFSLFKAARCKMERRFFFLSVWIPRAVPALLRPLTSLGCRAGRLHMDLCRAGLSAAPILGCGLWDRVRVWCFNPLLEPQETTLSRIERDPKYFTPFLHLKQPTAKARALLSGSSSATTPNSPITAWE